jgi:hypothetical protein
MLRAKSKNNKYQFLVSLWFEQTASRDYDLSDSRRTRLPLANTTDAESFFGFILLGIERTIY